MSTSSPSRRESSISFLDLPSELIHRICRFSTPECLGRLGMTCRQLRREALVEDLWAFQVNKNLAVSIKSPAPVKTWRELYIAFHHFWFLVRHRLWVSNLKYTGGLVVARWNSAETCIDLFDVVGDMGAITEAPYSEQDSISVVTYEPRHALLLDRPFFKIHAQYEDRIDDWISKAGLTPLLGGNAGMRQAAVDPASFRGSRPPAVIELATPITDYKEKRRVRYGDRIWPQPQVPSPGRVKRIDSRQIPSDRIAEPSRAAFRYRSTPSFSLLARDLRVPHSESDMHRRAESLRTFGTIDPSCYTPTAKKPYQGIWCGDFNGHGMEYLLLLQPDEGDLAFELDYLDILKGRIRANPWDSSGWARNEEDVPPGISHDRGTNAAIIESAPVGRLPPPSEDDQDSDSDDGYPSSASDPTTEPVDDFDDVEDPRLENPYAGLPHHAFPHNLGHRFVAATKPGGTKSGERLVAIKLTGDVNVPRGEISWLGYNIGEAGYVSQCSEPEFYGGRKVEAIGHVAHRGFVNDTWITTQLILISPDCIAQHWLDFGRIVHYYRVDVHELLNYGLNEQERGSTP